MPVRVGASTSSYSVGGGEPLLRQGAQGPAVRTLQSKLKALGYSVSVDGIFGPGTKAAVLAFQRAHGLSADGIVGTGTWGALDRGGASPAAPAPTGSHPTLSVGARGGAVTEMQRALSAAGYACTADGAFGPNTQAALKRFQAAHGLTADGICGPRTWAALTSGSSFTPAPAPSSGSTPTLRQGSSGAAVTRLQQLLVRAGYSVSVDGQFGPNTRAAVVRYQAAHGLSADGIVGPNTWAKLQGNAGPVSGPGPVAGPTSDGAMRAAILRMAESQIGTLEYGSSNSGPCSKYPNYFGRGSESWCADFVSWVYTHAGDAMNDPYCPSIVNSMRAQGKWKGRSNPQPGDRVLFDWNHDGVADHIGIVKAVNSNGTIETIEGNSAKPGTSQSGVWEHTRGMDTIMGFANP